MYFNPQPKEEIWRNKKYREWIAKWPPQIQGSGDTVCVHIRILGSGGTSIKPHDYFTLPLPDSIHKKIHNKGEITVLGSHFLSKEDYKKAKMKDLKALERLKKQLLDMCMAYKRVWDREQDRKKNS